MKESFLQVEEKQTKREFEFFTLPYNDPQGVKTILLFVDQALEVYLFRRKKVEIAEVARNLIHRR